MTHYCIFKKYHEICFIITNNFIITNKSRAFNTAYPPCQKLTLFLKKWLSLAGLSGPDGITNYALVWLVIFYLQVKLKIPSIVDLIKSHNQSKIISGKYFRDF